MKDLRRKYAGSVPLPQQEKYSNTMLELQNGKAKIEEELKKVSWNISDRNIGRSNSLLAKQYCSAKFVPSLN